MMKFRVKDVTLLTCFPQLIQSEAVNLQVTLETLFVYPGGQAAVLILCGRETLG